MKLSDELKDLAGHPDARVAYYASCYGDRVQALEERVAELEVGVQSERENFWAHDELLQVATARAEAAETEVARLRDVNAVTRERALQSEEIALAAIDERDGLRAKMEKVRAAIRVPTYNSHEKAYDAAYAALTDAESILDGEGDDDTFYKATKRLGWGDK